jgi:hypothetical protein
MTLTLSLIAILGIAAFLAGAAFGGLLIFVISIHRTSRTSLSESHGQRVGSVSRHVLTGIRTGRK